jgi:hypothetical protein
MARANRHYILPEAYKGWVEEVLEGVGYIQDAK